MSEPLENTTIKDSDKGHWVNRSPGAIQPYLQLSRLDRPIGYWLLALPGWIGLSFAAISHGFAVSDLNWAALILIGAVAMRGAGCTYNDIVDQDLDKQVERTALRPLPAGTVTNKQAWFWLGMQCLIGLMVLVCLPRFAQIIALSSLPLVAAYPFMKRITWWPQAWLGLTFNWAILVAYAAKTGDISLPALILYVGLIFWTIGYDTIYACQDIEDDAVIGVKSTARRFGDKVVTGIAIAYSLSFLFVFAAFMTSLITTNITAIVFFWAFFIFFPLGYGWHLKWQTQTLKTKGEETALMLFKSNFWAGLSLIAGFSLASYALHKNIFKSFL